MSSEVNPQVGMLVSNKPQAKEILNTLEKSPDNPFGFLEQIVNSPQVDTGKEVLAQVDAKRAEEAKKVEEAKKIEVKPEITKSEIPPVAVKETAPKVEEHKDDIVQEVIEEVGGKEESFKDLRKKLGETKSALKEKEKSLEELQTKVKKFETGEDFPEIIKQKDAKIAELSKYEKVVALKSSPEYKEKYIKPLATIKEKLSTIAKDYGVPEDTLHRAVEIKNVKELNTFLSDNFDPAGILEVKGLLTQAQEITKGALEAEKEPETAIQAIEQEFAQIRASQRVANVNKLISKSKGAWVNSLTKLREEGKVRELIPSDTDDLWNANVVEPIQEKAASEYAKIVKSLAEAGLEDIPDGLDYAIARMCQIAIASSVSEERAAIAEREAEELKINTTRTNKFIRPSIGGGTGQRPGISTNPRSPEEAADMALATALNKK